MLVFGGAQRGKCPYQLRDLAGMRIQKQRIESIGVDGIHVLVGRMPRVMQSRVGGSGICGLAGDVIGASREEMVPVP